jgi:murein DD-endopeptidase MepM/ murein hydrolase activator NlpD
MTLHAFLTVFLLLSLAGASAAASSAGIKAPKAIELRQGEIAELRVEARGAAAVEGWHGKELIQFFPAHGDTYTALIGADVEARPGIAKLVIRAVAIDGVASERQIEIRIKAKDFKRESFTVAGEFDQFTPELLERVRSEQEQFARVYSGSSPKRRWELPFIPPVPIEITSPFGYRRVINGTPRSPHTGTDLKAAAGTEIVVSNHGTVALTGDFYFAGKSVVVDHGGGLLTMYFHLSEIKVEQGAEVRKGEVIALSGMTGRVTGPHLHWAARAGAARVDPLQLIKKLGTQGKDARARASDKEKKDGER